LGRLVATMGSVSGEISKDLFHLQVPWEEKVIRAVVVYVFLLLALRLFGRRELGQSRRSIWWSFLRCRTSCRTR
jgi:hypothetical protein